MPRSYASPTLAGIIMEIGGKGELTDDNADQAAAAIVLANARHSSAEIALSIGGYDDDPRSLWDIPEAAAYFQRVMTRAGIDWRDRRVYQFSQSTVAVLVLCHALGDDCPFEAIVTPATVANSLQGERP